MDSEREYIEPVTIERDENKTVDTESKDGVEQHDTSDPRVAIAEKHAQKQRSEMGIEELTPVEMANPDMVLVKVNGKERQVPRQKVEESGGLDVYQKRLAAEERLQEASLQKKQLDQQQSELQRKVSEFQNWQQQQIARLAQERTALAQSRTPPAGSQSDEEAKSLAKRHIQALIDGEDDLAADLLLKLQERNRPQQVDVSEIERRAVAKVQAMQQKQAWDSEHAMALGEFKEQYSDVMSNPKLVEVADQYTIHLQQTTNLTPRAILKQAGDYARQFRDEIAGVRMDNSRSDAKKAMSVARAATGRNPTPTPNKPQSSSGYIESLKAARGQL